MSIISNLKAGYKGRVYIGTVKIGGIVSWTYGGETRMMVDADEFGDEDVVQLPTQKFGGEINISGHYRLDSDEGQKLIKTLFDAATLIGNIRLFTDYSNSIYLAPSAGSHVVCTNCTNVGDEKSGIGTYSATFKVNGSMSQSGATSPSASGSTSSSVSPSTSVSASLSASPSASPSSSPSE